MVPAVKDSVTPISGMDTLVRTGAGKLIGGAGKLFRWKGDIKKAKDN